VKEARSGLTSPAANRADLDYLLLNIVDPSAILAKDYQMSIVHTTDGRSRRALCKNRTMPH